MDTNSVTSHACVEYINASDVCFFRGRGKQRRAVATLNANTIQRVQFASVTLNIARISETVGQIKLVGEREEGGGGREEEPGSQSLNFLSLTEDDLNLALFAVSTS